MGYVRQNSTIPIVSTGISPVAVGTRVPRDRWGEASRRAAPGGPRSVAAVWKTAILAALQPPADHHRISQTPPGRDGVPPSSAPHPPVVARGACLPPTDSPRHIRLAHRINDPPDILQRILRTQRDADHALCLTYRKPNRLQHVRHLRVPRIARRTGGNGNPFQIKNMDEAFPRPARQRDTHESRQLPRRVYAREDGIRKRRNQLRPQTLGQSVKPLTHPRHPRAVRLERRRHADNRRHVLRSGPSTVLLLTTVQKRCKLQSLANKQESNPFRAVELVCARRKKRSPKENPRQVSLRQSGCVRRPGPHPCETAPLANGLLPQAPPRH